MCVDSKEGKKEGRIPSITAEWGSFIAPLGRIPLLTFHEQMKLADLNFPKLHSTIILKNELLIPSEKAK